MLYRLTLTCLLSLLLTACNTDAPPSNTTSSAAASVASDQTLTVYKSPQCGCCGDWVEHMKAQGFQVQVIEQNDLSTIKDRYGVPQALRSCHTAVIGDHVIEGHVPAAVIKRFLGESNPSKGLAVPGMPVGSPGMEMGDRFQPYAVASFDSDGNSQVYVNIDSPADQR